jgi:hypothetical protein
MRRFRPFLAILLALLLLGAQQAAFAHLISHLHAPTATIEHCGDGSHHGDHDSLTHVCSTCLAFAALVGGALPSAPAALLGAADLAAPPLSPLLPAVAAAPFRHYRARAPPAFSQESAGPPQVILAP